MNDAQGRDELSHATNQAAAGHHALETVSCCVAALLVVGCSVSRYTKMRGDLFSLNTLKLLDKSLLIVVLPTGIIHTIP